MKRDTVTVLHFPLLTQVTIESSGLVVTPHVDHKPGGVPSRWRRSSSERVVREEAIR